MAISRGLSPVVCCVSGVSGCFGGIIRDLICKRDVAMGSQSFAASSAAGAIMYVLLREACLRGVSVPLGVRIILSSCTAASVRIIDYVRDTPLLSPMHGFREPRPELVAATLSRRRAAARGDPDIDGGEDPDGPDARRLVRKNSPENPHVA